MNKDNYHSSVFLLCICLILSCKSQRNATPKVAMDKPNIIFILADDLGYGEVGAYGQTKIETPNIDALANEGMLFTDFYAGAPVCAPSRAVLLSGQHLGHTAIRGNDEWGDRGDVWDYRKMALDSTLEGQRPIPSTTVMIPQLLKQEGYMTALIGKWGLGAPHTESIPNKMGFDYFFGYNCQRQAHTYFPTHLYENESRYPLRNDTVAPGTGLVKGADSLALASYTAFTQPDYSEEVSFGKLMNFVDKNKRKPFFLYWASPIPHLPLQAPKRWVDHYVAKFGDEKPYVFYQKGSYFPCRYPRATYAGMVSYLDENIGTLVAYLKKEGLYDNTIIMFSSDNGPSYTGGTDSKFFDSAKPFKSSYGRGKGFVYEGGIRVPFIVTWPNRIKPKSTSNHIGSFTDILPTLCEINNINPSSSDGISIKKTLIGAKTQKKRNYLYYEFPEYNGQVTVRIKDYKIIWKDIKLGNKAIEVYNLKADITESNNIVSQHSELVEQFYNIIRAEHTTPENKRFEIPALEELCQK